MTTTIEVEQQEDPAEPVGPSSPSLPAVGGGCERALGVPLPAEDPNNPASGNPGKPEQPASDGMADHAVSSPIPAAVLPIPEVLPVVDVQDLDWPAVRQAANAAAIRARMRGIVEQMEVLLDRAAGPGLMFDGDRADAADRVIHVLAPQARGQLWIIGDLHGDLLALEAALMHIQAEAAAGDGAAPRIVFLGDFFDDEGFGLEVVLRVFELIVAGPESVCVVAGNHDEALAYDGTRFSSSVSPSDFADFLNNNLAHEWIERAGKLAVRLTAHVPRALFFPDGLLIAHGGFPLSDLHPKLIETADWNNPACLSDFVWARAHPKARRKMPNRFTRGSQFGHEDFADFCALSARLGRPVTHMARGHDHIEERYAIYPAYQSHPVVTTVALSRRLDRERFGSFERVPTLLRVVEGAVPQVHRLHIPGEMIRDQFPQVPRSNAEVGADGGAQE